MLGRQLLPDVSSLLREVLFQANLSILSLDCLHYCWLLLLGVDVSMQLLYGLPDFLLKLMLICVGVSFCRVHRNPVEGGIDTEMYVFPRREARVR